MVDLTDTNRHSATSAGGRFPRFSGAISWTWLGLAPFFLFCLLFLILPVLYLINGALQTPDGRYSLETMLSLRDPQFMSSYWLSIRLSAVSAASGTIFGLLLCCALLLGGLPGWVRRAFLTFSGVASNFAGVPLAFAFIATLGRLGLVTLLMRDFLGINIYATGFTLFSFWGLALTYLYFQLPLMLLMIMPAVEGLRPEWREAAESLGERAAILVAGGIANSDAFGHWLFSAALRQCFWHACDDLCADIGEFPGCACRAVPADPGQCSL